MRRHLKSIAIIGFFFAQLAFLQQRQSVFSSSAMRMADLQEQRLLAEGIPRNQAAAIIFAMNDASDRAAAYADGITRFVGFTSFLAIIGALSGRAKEKS